MINLQPVAQIIYSQSVSERLCPERVPARHELPEAEAVSGRSRLSRQTENQKKKKKKFMSL